MKTLFLLAIVGYLPLICSGTKSIHDWAHELGNKLGPGYSFREVQRDGRTCICSTTLQSTTQTVPGSTEVPTSTAADTTVKTTSLAASTEVPTSTAAETTVKTASLASSTEVPTSTAAETTVKTASLASSTDVADTSTETQKSTSEKKETTTKEKSTSGLASTTEVPTTTERAATSTEEAQASTSLPGTTTLPASTTFSTQFNFGGFFGARSINCDDNVVPVANDRNAATKYSFSTPLYPDEYPENTCCVWRIVYPEEWMRQASSRIITYNYSPDSFLPEECTSDFVTVYDITANNRLVEREEKCGHIGGQLGIIKHDGDERGTAFRVCKDEERAGAAKARSSESTGKVAISFTVVAF